MVQLSHPYMTARKTIALTRWTFVGKVISLLFNMLSRLVIAFLPRSRHLLISWLQSPSAVILEPPSKSNLPLFPLFPHLFPMKWRDQMPWSDGTRFHDLSFMNVELWANFFTLFFTFNKRHFSSSLISAIMVVPSAYLWLLIFLLAILIPVVLLPAQCFSWCTLHQS